MRRRTTVRLTGPAAFLGIGLMLAFYLAWVAAVVAVITLVVKAIV